MAVVLLIARLVLALVFAVAGVAKALDRAGSRQAFVEFGVSESLAKGLALVLPLVEVLIALALIPQSSAWWGAVASLAVLLVFAAAIGVKLARGQAPDCRCFGQLYSEPVSWSTFARNLALAATAGLIVIEGRDSVGLSALSWLADLRTSEIMNIALGLVLIGLLTLAIVLLKEILKHQAKLIDGMEAIKGSLNEDGEPGQMLRREADPPKEGLPVGAQAPGFSLPTLNGERVSLEYLLGRGKPVLLLFGGPNCWGCKVLLPAVRIWERDYADLLTIAVLSTGSLEENRNKMSKYEIGNLLLDEDSSVADEYQAKWSPAVVLIDHNGRVASKNTYGDNAIREWLRNLVASGQVRPGSSNGHGTSGLIHQVSTTYSVREIGEPAPRFSLEDLAGNMVDLEDFRGSSTLLLFWHPRCLICAELFDDLKAWEDHHPLGAPSLVFVATGEVDDVKLVNKHFDSLTLLDPEFDVAPLFGTKFTPSAILIDDEGRIASSLAMGDENVRALIGLPKAGQRRTGLPVVMLQGGSVK